MNFKNRRSKLIVFIALFLTTLAVVIFGFLFSAGSKNEPQWLGNPLREEGLTGRALNVWDLQVFDGKVYIAGGSTVSNSGPIKVFAYNLCHQILANPKHLKHGQ